MAIIFSDGCGEYYSTTEIANVWTSTISGPTVVATGGRRNGAYLNIASLDAVIKTFTAQQEIFFGFAVRIPSLSQTDLVDIKHVSTTHLVLSVNSDGSLELSLSGSPILTTAAGLITQNIWQYIEVRALIDNSPNGAVEIRVDGIQRAVDTSADTQNGGSALINEIRFQEDNQTFHIDDVYILDTTGTPAPQKTFLGDVEIELLLPDGAGNTSDFDTATPSANHWENVDETPPDGDTSYNETAVVNDVDLFTYAALTSITGGSTVLGVKAAAFAKKTDGGDGDMRLVARPVSTNRNGATKTLATDYTYHNEYWDINPETSAAWTDALINSSEFGVEVV